MIYTNSDGGSRGNPGPAAVGALVRNNDSILEICGEKIGKATNNVAEYKALIKALELAKKYTDDEIICVLDSQLIVKQLLGEYQVKSPELMKLFLEIQKLQENFKKIKYVHVSRWNQFQQIVDNVLNMEMDERN